MKQFKKLLLLTVVISSVLIGCKKDAQETTKNVLTNQQIINGYTTIPNGLNPVLQKIANKLKEKEDAKPFLVTMGNKVGLPLWNKAQIKSKKQNANAAIETVEDETITVIVPLSAPNTQEVDGFLACEVSETDVLINEFDKYNYEQYGFGKPDGQLDAEEIIINLLLLNKELFGYKEFTLTDPKLFKLSDPNKILSDNTEIVIGGSPVDGPSGYSIIVITHHHCTHTGKCASGTCDECNWCVSTEMLVYGGFDWNDGGGNNGTNGGDDFSGGAGNNSIGGGAIIITTPTIPTFKLFENINKNQIAYLTANQAVLNSLVSFISNNGSTEIANKIAFSALVALMNNKINGPYDQQFFDDYVKPNLTPNLQNVNSEDFLEIFNYHINDVSVSNPTYSSLDVFLAANLNSINILENDYNINDDPASYDLNNLDNNIYTPFDFLNPATPWHDYNNVLPTTFFVPYDKEKYPDLDCFGVAKARLAKMGYKISDYKVPPDQTITCYARKKNSSGKYVEGDYDDNAIKIGIDYLQKALAAGKPVMVGVECRDRLNQGHKKSDNTTDHWVIINGSGTDNFGNHYFTYVETDTKNMTNSYTNPKTGQPYKLWIVPGEGLVSDCNTTGCTWGKKVTQIRKTKT